MPELLQASDLDLSTDAYGLLLTYADEPPLSLQALASVLMDWQRLLVVTWAADVADDERLAAALPSWEEEPSQVQSYIDAAVQLGITAGDELGVRPPSGRLLYVKKASPLELAFAVPAVMGAIKVVGMLVGLVERVHGLRVRIRSDELAQGGPRVRRAQRHRPPQPADPLAACRQ